MAQKKRKGFASDFVESVVFAAVLTLIIRMLIFQAFRIPSGSMENTLLVGDFLFVNKFVYGAKIEIPFTRTVLVRLPRLRDPRRGDVIVFRNPANPDEDYIKRCIGLPGDVIEVRNKQLYRNGKPVTGEKYIQHVDPDTFPREMEPRDNFGPFTVEPGHYFMMGDNRDNSQDSRWFGAVDDSLLRGEAVFIYWSWDSLPGAQVGNLLLPHGVRLGRLFHLIH